MPGFEKARELLSGFKGERYLYGLKILSKTGGIVGNVGRRAALVATSFPGIESFLRAIRRSFEESGVRLAAEIEGAAPNAPLEDLNRITGQLKKSHT